MISAIIKLITKTLKYARLDEAGKALGGIKEIKRANTDTRSPAVEISTFPKSPPGTS